MVLDRDSSDAVVVVDSSRLFPVAVDTAEVVAAAVKTEHRDTAAQDAVAGTVVGTAAGTVLETVAGTVGVVVVADVRMDGCHGAVLSAAETAADRRCRFSVAPAAAVDRRSRSWYVDAASGDAPCGSTWLN